MPTLSQVAVIASVASLLSGCTSFQRISPPTSGAVTCSTLATVYSRSYFQTRYQGAFIASMVLGGPVVAATMMSQSQDVDRSRERLASGPFERLLGNFDVLAHVAGEFRQALTRARVFAVTTADEPATAVAIAARVRSAVTSGAVPVTGPDGRTPECLAAFKVAYGLGARGGAEQLGFRKSYRPFVQIVGVVERSDTRRVLWRDAVISFGPKRYLGGDAEHERIDRIELTVGIEAATRELLGQLVNSLNGEALMERASLVDGNDKDLEL